MDSNNKNRILKVLGSIAGVIMAIKLVVMDDIAIGGAIGLIILCSIICGNMSVFVWNKLDHYMQLMENYLC